jgi:hypothetical protein
MEIIMISFKSVIAVLLLLAMDTGYSIVKSGQKNRAREMTSLTINPHTNTGRLLWSTLKV